MKPLRKFHGDLLILDFCFTDRSNADAFAGLVEHCCRHGAKPEEMIVSRYPGARSSRTSAPPGMTSREKISAAELLDALADPDTRVGEVALWNAIGASREFPEIIRTGLEFVHDAGEYHWKDGLPTTIESEGWVFSPAGSRGDAQRAGRKAYRRFREACEELDPAYAAIFVEESLIGSEALKSGMYAYRDPDFFHDFYVSGTAFGPRIVRRIEDKYADAYIEQLGNGVFVSCSEVFNPEGIRLDRKDSREWSASVARLLRSAL